VDYDAVRQWKKALLAAAWRRHRHQGSSAEQRDFERFQEAEEQASWLEDWCLYSTIKESQGGKAWMDWPQDLRSRDRQALLRVEHEAAEQVGYHAFVQFLFARQWQALHTEAAARSIEIIGDLPFYPSLDSAEVWSRPELFEIDAEGRPTAVAGVPPDYFSPTGQRWGNPLYRWERHREEGFQWWCERLRVLLRAVDRVRIDHFRGFESYWAVPGDEDTAANGRWLPGPGMEIFARLREEIPTLPILAEDLGEITDAVRHLRRETGLPGMKVLQFAFDSVNSEHLPHNIQEDSVVYTGTHDNNTTVGWFREAPETTRRRALDYLGGDAEEIHWNVIRAAHTSAGRLAMIPMQDLLGLDGRHRMNTPGVATGNWVWRVAAPTLESAPWERLRRLTDASARLPEMDDQSSE
jgi:4-alpha-glucanotransferase